MLSLENYKTRGHELSGLLICFIIVIQDGVVRARQMRQKTRHTANIEMGTKEGGEGWMGLSQVQRGFIWCMRGCWLRKSLKAVKQLDLEKLQYCWWNWKDMGALGDQSMREETNVSQQYCQDVAILGTQMSQMRAQKANSWRGWCTNKGNLNWRSFEMMSLKILRVFKILGGI